MSRVDVVADVLLDVALLRLAGVAADDAWAHVSALAVLGALSEYERGDRSGRATQIFGRLRNPAAEPAGELAGADAAYREEAEALTESLRSSAPADQPKFVMTDVTVTVTPVEEEAVAGGEVGASVGTPAGDPQSCCDASAPPPFACTCGRSFASAAGLGGHKASCGKTSTCICGRVFTSNAILAAHRRGTRCPGPATETVVVAGQPPRDEIDLVVHADGWQIYRMDTNVLSVDVWPNTVRAYEAFDTGTVTWSTEAAIA